MFKKIALTVLTVFLLLSTGTQNAKAEGFSPANSIYTPEGGIYTKAQVPLSIPKEGVNYEGEVIPVSNTKKQDINLEGLKVGTSSCINVLGLVQLGDGGIYQAAKSAGIKKVHYVDVVKEHLYAYYFFYTKLTTYVYGE